MKCPICTSAIKTEEVMLKSGKKIKHTECPFCKYINVITVLLLFLIVPFFALAEDVTVEGGEFTPEDGFASRVLSLARSTAGVLVLIGATITAVTFKLSTTYHRKLFLISLLMCLLALLLLYGLDNYMVPLINARVTLGGEFV